MDIEPGRGLIVDRRLSLGLVGHVGLQANAADLGCDLLGAFEIDVETGDLGAPCGQRPRRSRAEP